MLERNKKLTLSKETLRTLDDQDLTDVVGGATGICVGIGKSVVCNSAVCDIEVGPSVVCRSVACNSVAICQ